MSPLLSRPATAPPAWPAAVTNVSIWTGRSWSAPLDVSITDDTVTDIQRHNGRRRGASPTIDGTADTAALTEKLRGLPT